MPLIHLPVQSGSNKILKKMNRRHTVEYYMNIIKELKKINSRIEFSSDFIIGFPGETSRDFDQTLALLEKVKYINSYSFIFSPRPGTPAANMTKVEDKIARERLTIFQNKAREIKINYRQKLFDKKSMVLIENRIGKNDEFFGRDEYSNSVIIKSDKNLSGKIIEVKIRKGNQNTFFGEISHKPKIERKDFAA